MTFIVTLTESVSSIVKSSVPFTVVAPSIILTSVTIPLNSAVTPFLASLTSFIVSCDVRAADCLVAASALLFPSVNLPLSPEVLSVLFFRLLLLKLPSVLCMSFYILLLL